MKSTDHVALVKCSIDMRVSPENDERAVELLVSAIGRTEAKTGCLTCAVARDVTEKGQLLYSETWISQAAFQRHVQSEEFRHVLMAIDMCSEAPNVVIGSLTGRSGIAYLQELREEQNENK